MSAKIATLGLLKKKLFWNNSYDVIIYDHGVTNKILLYYSNYFVGVLLWPNFGNSSISMRKVIVTSISQEFDQKNHFFEG